MREELAKHFDVIVVIWVLSLAVGWSMLTLSRAQLSNDQWTGDEQQNRPAWVISGDDTK